MINKIKRVFEIFGEKRLSTITGAWVFYFLMSVIPLAFLLATAFGLFGINVLNDLVLRLPEEFRTAGQAIAETAENVSKGATIFFILTVIFSCTTLLNQMSKDGDFIYGVTRSIKRGFMRRIWAIVALGALFTIFLAMALIFAFRAKIFAQVSVNPSLKLVLTVLAFLLVILFCYTIIILLYKYISPVKQRVKELLVGGFFSLTIIVLGTLGLAIYLRFLGGYNALYGSLTSILVFLLWAYIVMLGLVIGVIVNKCAYQTHVQKSNTEKPKKVKINKKPAKVGV